MRRCNMPVRIAAVAMMILGAATPGSAGQPQALYSKVTSSAPATAEKAGARYVSADFHYSFAPPVGWTRREDVPARTLAFAAPPENGFATNVTVSVYSHFAKNMDEAAFVHGLQVNNGVIYSMKRCSLAGKPAHSWRTHLHVPEYPALENRQVVCFWGGKAYELTFTVLPAAQSKQDAVFDRLLASFRWEKAPGAAVGLK